MNSTLSSLMACFDEYSDMTIYKNAISLFDKMVYCWGGIGSPSASTLKQTRTLKPKEILIRRPLDGFDSFILDQIVPILFHLPMRSNFNIKDGTSLLVIGEIALLHSTIYQVLGTPYIEYLTNMYLPTLNCPEPLRFEFATAVTEQDKKKSRKMIQTIFGKLKG